MLNSEIRSLSQPRAALLAFGVAALAYNVLSVIATTVRIRHELDTSDIELSPYYLASEIRATYAGMMIAVPPEVWQAYDLLTPAQLGRELIRTLILARCANIRGDRKRLGRKAMWPDA
ncbi:hypothetical protein [Cupriavidus sp. CP313]